MTRGSAVQVFRREAESVTNYASYCYLPSSSEAPLCLAFASLSTMSKLLACRSRYSLVTTAPGDNFHLRLVCNKSRTVQNNVFHIYLDQILSRAIWGAIFWRDSPWRRSIHFATSGIILQVHDSQIFERRLRVYSVLASPNFHRRLVIRITSVLCGTPASSSQDLIHLIAQFVKLSICLMFLSRHSDIIYETDNGHPFGKLKPQN